MAISVLLAVIVLMAVKNEDLIIKNNSKGIHDDENNVCLCTGNHLFVHSATCSVLSCFAVSDCHSQFSVICTAFCSGACWLKANNQFALMKCRWCALWRKMGSLGLAL